MSEAEPKLFLIQGDVYEVEKLVAVKIVKVSMCGGVWLVSVYKDVGFVVFTLR